MIPDPCMRQAGSSLPAVMPRGVSARVIPAVKRENGICRKKSRIVLRQKLPEQKDFRYVFSAFLFINIVKAVFHHIFIGVCHVFAGKTLGKICISRPDGLHDGAVLFVGGSSAADV